jgi:hypothetical protein
MYAAFTGMESTAQSFRATASSSNPSVAREIGCGIGLRQLSI